ncbi:MAG TPA: DMT family transporter [Segeticoccus sp.]|uniref:DMT family transporter n=1 Tax=Segeticoccus sp. TaxID=2706531 RepID=UPI002D8093FD|nr:DMT family transporter [Segeticoccus sp.]HET8602281.1 DMT family transporter [Segeticoccus sp.]
MSPLAVVAALAASGCLALSNAMQHHTARQVPSHRTVHLGVIGRLITRPLWLAASAVNGVALVLQALALSRGALTVVQPLLVSALLFALPISRMLTGRRIQRVDYGWAALVVAGLTTFLLVAAPTGGLDIAPGARFAVALAICAVVTVGLVAWSFRPSSRHRPALLGLATGICAGVVAALIKQITAIIVRGLPALLTSWELYSFLLAGACALVLGQSAYHAGPLTGSLPAISMTDPVVGIVLGIYAFEETLTTAPLMLAVSLVGFLAMTTGVVALARRSAAEPVPVSGGSGPAGGAHSALLGTDPADRD